MIAGLDRNPALRLQITTRENPQEILNQMGQGPWITQHVTIAFSVPDAVPSILQWQICSVMFYASGEVSELGRSPTRMAEILVCGLPVVANEGVGDVAEIIRVNRVGILVEGGIPDELRVAWDNLDKLLLDPNLGARCREAASSMFSLDAGTKAYQALYEDTIQCASSREARLT
jgi:glycosyltransferase involved in cell wall biosynthesis